MGIVQNTLSSIKTWWKRQRTLVKSGIIFGLVSVLIVVLKNGSDSGTVIESVTRQDLARTVSATGTVVSTTDLALSFQETNLVQSIYVSVGDKVKRGQVLATLSNASEAAAIASARGALSAAKAKEAKVLAGVGGDEIRLAEVAVANARRTLYSDDLVAKDDLGRSDDAPTITGTYNGSADGKYVIEFDRSSTDLKYSGLENGRVLVGSNPVALGSRGLLIAFPDDSTRTIGNEWTILIPNRDGANYTTNLNAYNNALAELALKKSVAPGDLDVARADVVSAQASLASAQAAFEKTVIRAPADGTITKIDIKLGELAEKFDPVITLQDVGNLYIEARINESNISNIAIGQKVSITYDAFGKDAVSTSSVSSVDLGATVVDGIVNYEVKSLVSDPTNIRSGMTANLSIQTAFSPDVLVVPERVIKEDDGKKTVEVLVDERRGATETRTIKTGLRGDGGLVEVTSGLSEGEKVVWAGSTNSK